MILIREVELDSDIYYPGSPFQVKIWLKKNMTDVSIKNVHVAMFVVDALRNIVYHLSTMFLDREDIPFTETDCYRFLMERLNLSPGIYNLWVWLQGNGFEQDYVDTEISFEVCDGNVYGAKSPKIISIVQKEFEFSIG